MCLVAHAHGQRRVADGARAKEKNKNARRCVGQHTNSPAFLSFGFGAGSSPLSPLTGAHVSFQPHVDTRSARAPFFLSPVPPSYSIHHAHRPLPQPRRHGGGRGRRAGRVHWCVLQESSGGREARERVGGRGFFFNPPPPLITQALSTAPTKPFATKCPASTSCATWGRRRCRRPPCLACSWGRAACCTAAGGRGIE